MKLCAQCSAPTVTVTEIGWRKLRIVGDSPHGYRWKVSTIRVPTVIVACDTCDWEQHGYIHNQSLYAEDETVEVLSGQEGK